MKEPKPHKEMSKRTKTISTIIIAVFVLAVMIYANYENNTLTRTDLTLKFNSLPTEFDDFRVVQLSDLHGKVFGKGNATLMAMVKAAKPDMIAITGDLVSEADAFMNEYIDRTIRDLVAIAPVYYVPGNNEIVLSGYKELKIKLETLGAVVLDNRWTQITKNGASILVAGIDDPGKNKTKDTTFIKDNLKMITDQLRPDPAAPVPFKMLLAHRPQFFDAYSAAGFDLVLAGHTHGGQIRIPGIGALYLPDQGLFPHFVAGLFTTDTSTMYISRGLGNNGMSQRLFDMPEVVVLTLDKNNELEKQ